MRTLGLVAALSAAAVHDSHAVVHLKGAEAPVVSAERGPRVHRTVDWKSIATLPGWTAMWDRDTDVPLRLWGSTSPIPGSVANAAVAEAAARQFLHAHLALLAPGAKPGDFELAANVLSPKGDIRSVGFVQRVGGMRVLGGNIGFAFKADRLALVSSTALPHVSIVPPQTRLPATTIAEAAQRWLRTDGHEVTIAPETQLVVVPIVRPRVGATPDISYRIAEQLSAAATTSPGAWNVWIDATTAKPIERRSTLHYVTGTVKYDVPVRHPAGMRSAYAAALANLTIDGTAKTTDLSGSVMWTGAGSATVRATGPLISVTSPTAATSTLQLTSGGTATWSLASSETGDAQLAAFIHAGVVKQFAKTRLNPTLPWLAQTLTVSVNESGSCNAFSTGDDIHFLRKNAQCENTARLADVVYHEFGHSLHNNSIIEGVGSWDGALSEGLSDILAMLLTHDSGMGRGFFLSNTGAPMRELNPPNKEKKWGIDTTGQVHNDGEVIGGTFWDLMISLEAKLGQAAGFEKTLDIYYTTMQRASDIPTSYAEALLGDDDDGDLANGTPNKCAIHAAFALHNLVSGAPPMGTVDKPTRTGFNISVKAQIGETSSACPSPAITAGEIAWRLRGGTDAKVPMTMVADKFEGAIPSQPNGSVVQYKVTLTLSDGQKVVYPNNAADPYYEMYVGPVTPIWCASFETGAGDWTTSPDWEAGPALGLGGDPKTAAGGTNVFGSDLSQDGTYAASGMSFAESPEIDLQGKTGVRLQMQRWLGVEDGFYDKAKLSINGAELWKNFTSPTEPQQASDEVNHLDREWRFADFDLAAHQASGKVKLRFELASDEGLQFGGWTLDDVCVVVPAQGPGDPNCGNGAVDPGEACDDGNVTAGDGCNALCEMETGEEEEEEGSDDAGCCSVGGGPKGALALTLLTLGLILRRRRR
ncbi:MAG: MYXO-CTERM sorting domain-containing protein [Myxococcota bacterium]|nr:MYXO-CTERM sorting domain-containing protein [Myxococcota bacterium]